MRLYPIKTPHIIKRIFSNFVWCFSLDKKILYLTFDDGPIPEVTEFVLSKLKEYNAKATFFCIGANIQKHPTIFAKIIKDGHRIGNHTFHHRNGWKTSNSEYVKDVLLCEKIIKKQAVYELPSLLFRPPYGKIKPAQAKHLKNKGYQMIMWDVISGDFDRNITKEKCSRNVLKNAKNGSIVVFHDSIKAREKLYYTLPIILETFTKKGYQFHGI